ncbi:MAG TPA: DUF1015 domain-containing protein, partial [Acidimicrobiales bacterium]
MARFEPFPGIRYDLDRNDLGRVIAPPYDVIDGDLRQSLVDQDPHNAVLIDLPAESDGEERYQMAQRRLADWLADGTLVTDDRPSFTVYRMVATDDAGVERRTTGVIGALELSPPGTDILPHEHTTPKAKSDRLDLLRSCRANLSAIWGLSLAKGLTDLLPVDQPPLADLVDDDGVRHTVWRVDDPATCAAISAAVGEHPVVVADGHHRYETSLAYKGEREQAEGSAGAAGATMAYVVELVEDELTVHAIHRLLTGLPDDLDLVAALSPWFEEVGAVPEATPMTAAMAEAGCLAVVLPDREVLIRPRPDALTEARDLDSSRLDVALAALPSHTLSFQHGVDNVRNAVRSGAAQAGVLLRPATVAQIEATAHGGERMPPKTTFFSPKPKTGLVFRG